MKSARRHIAPSALAVLAGMAAFAPARADDDVVAAAEVAALPGLPSAPRLAASPLAPLEDILRSIERSNGYSFIFDSRLIRGKVISPVDRSAEPEAALQKELAAVDLKLHKITTKTFAIARAAQPDRPDLKPAAKIEAPAIRDTIVVLATAPIAGAALGSRRIFEIDSDQLAYLNVSNPADALYDLPQSLASFTPANTALFGATAGISLADLRGLDPMHTVVMVNGRKRTITSGGNGNIAGVDLNSIAEPFLERIEVHNLPGGARFGPHAVAGAINFVTKSNIQGIESGARFGISEQGDSEDISLHVLAGTEFAGGDGAITAGVNVTRSEGIIGADRSFSATPWGFGFDGRLSNSPDAQFLPGYGGSSITEIPTVSGVILDDGSFAPFAGGARYRAKFDGTIERYQSELGQLFNWTQWQSVVLPSDRALGFVSASRAISPSVNLFIDAFGGYSATDGLLAPLPGSRFQGHTPVVGDAAVIPVANSTIPQSVHDLLDAEFGASASAVIVDKRYVELGPRRQQVDRTYADIALGAEIDAGPDTHYSFTYRYANNRVVSSETDRIDRNMLTIALDPAQCAVTAGCVDADLFAPGGLTPEALAFVTIDELRRRLTVQEHELSARATRRLSFANGAAGNLAAGIDVKRAIFADIDLTPDDVAPIGHFNFNTVKQNLDTVDAFVEADLPVLHQSAIGDLDATTAFRTTVSSTFNPAINFEGGVNWRPVDGVLLFTRQHVGRRTPSIIDLFTISETVEGFFTDPCGIPPQFSTPEIIANCASAGPLGVNPGFSQTNPLTSNTTYGNPDLKSEKIRSAAYGLTITPTDFFPDAPGRLQITGTWLDYEIQNAVVAPNNMLTACYTSVNLSSPACGVNPATGELAIKRDPATRQVAAVDVFLNNDGLVRWRGLDLELRYAYKPLDLGPVDRLWLNILHTYTHRVVNQFDAGDPVNIEGLVRDPRHRTLLTVGVEGGRYGLALFGNRRGRALTIRDDIPEAKVSPAFYLDASFRINFGDDAYVQAGVQNLTDIQPEITAFNRVGNFAPEFYDPVGRRFSLTFRSEF